jgi:hypothetical protein
VDLLNSEVGKAGGRNDLSASKFSSFLSKDYSMPVVGIR